MTELANIKQGMNESIENYTARFRSILRIATRGQALHDTYQVNYYIQGLEPIAKYQVRMANPANLNEAVNAARRVEEAKSELMDKPIVEQSKQAEIPENKPRNIFEKPLEKNYEDDITKMFEKLEVKLLDRVKGQGRPSNNNQGNVTCFKCSKNGHYSRECRARNNQGNHNGRPNN